MAGPCRGAPALGGGVRCCGRRAGNCPAGRSGSAGCGRAVCRRCDGRRARCPGAGKGAATGGGAALKPYNSATPRLVEWRYSAALFVLSRWSRNVVTECRQSVCVNSRTEMNRQVKPLPSCPVPAQVGIVCGTLTGVLLTRRMVVRLHDGREVSPTEFEREGGKGSSKKCVCCLRWTRSAHNLQSFGVDACAPCARAARAAARSQAAPAPATPHTASTAWKPEDFPPLDAFTPPAGGLRVLEQS